MAVTVGLFDKGIKAVGGKHAELAYEAVQAINHVNGLTLQLGKNNVMDESHKPQGPAG